MAAFIIAPPLFRLPARLPPTASMLYEQQKKEQEPQQQQLTASHGR
jgi:hypothetical protein